MKPKVIRISTIPLSLDLLLQGQLKMLAETYEVLAVSSPGEALEKVAKREGVRTCAIPMERHIAPLKDLIALIRLIALFRKEKPQIVHSLTPKAGLLAMMAARLCRIPVRIHTFTGLIFPSTTGWKQRLLIATDRLTCACATYINPEGNGVKKDLEHFHITKRALHLIGNGNINGIDLTYFDRTPEVMEKAKIYRDDTCFVFCFVGRLVHDKGIDELVSAFVRLQQEFRNCRLWLVGNFESELDPVTPETEACIHRHPAIKFMGWQEDIRPFLAAADAFVFPSYREGFPNVVLQAGAMGLPCIVTDINGCNEIIEDGRNGVIIPSHDSECLYRAMRNFISSPRFTEQLAQNARLRIAQRYDRRMLWDALGNVYQEQISNLIK
ncbi:MAG: glycosyltransferase family 4 protein [Bacteroidales bacterium]|nr:glycosyltransferase family 4 protein [Bacteroidales bacterium]